MSMLSEVQLQIPSLLKLSLKGLTRLYDEKQGLFSLYFQGGNIVPTPLSWSICYTAITLLGLHKARSNGWQESPVVFDERKALNSLVGLWKDAKEFGHLGLIQWANAECGGRYAENITEEIVNRSTENHLKRLPTTQLAWLLTGFSTTYQRLSSDNKIKELAELYYRAIVGNFNPQTGLFCHTQNKANTLDLRSQIGNFADQIYAIFALSTYYEVFNDGHALQQALQCADRLCEFQGENGQWCWHYHSRSGSVVSRYPVFSVHQDGMAPMGLKKLTVVSGKDFQAPIYKGLNWLFGSNELGLNMIDYERNLIWRDIERAFPASTARYIPMLLAEIGFKGTIQKLNSPFGLKLNREMRSYELGWLLYAFADQQQV